MVNYPDQGQGHMASELLHLPIDNKQSINAIIVTSSKEYYPSGPDRSLWKMLYLYCTARRDQ
jgi:hypothetical protein